MGVREGVVGGAGGGLIGMLRGFVWSCLQQKKFGVTFSPPWTSKNTARALSDAKTTASRHRPFRSRLFSFHFTSLHLIIKLQKAEKGLEPRLRHTLVRKRRNSNHVLQH